LKKLLFLLIIPLYLIAGITINKPFKQEILNEPLKDMKELYTFKDLSKVMLDKYGYNLISHIPEIESDKKFFTDQKEYVGEFLVEVADAYQATFEVDDKKGKITFKPKFSTFVKFPAGWDMYETINDLQLNFPNVIFKISSNRIYAYGTEKQIDTIQPLLNNLEYITNKSNSFILRILPYKTEETSPDFIGYKKSYGNSLDNNNVFLEKVIHLKHGDQFSFQVLNRIINVKFNMIKEAIIFDDYYEIPLSEIYNLGYVVTLTEKTKKYVLIDDAIKKHYIIEIEPTDL